MNFIELTRLDDTRILINKTNIASVVTVGKNSVIIYSGGNRQEVKESYDQIKIALTNNMILN